MAHTLTELKARATELGLTPDEVRQHGNLSYKATWEAAIAEFEPIEPIASESIINTATEVAEAITEKGIADTQIDDFKNNDEWLESKSSPSPGVVKAVIDYQFRESSVKPDAFGTHRFKLDTSKPFYAHPAMGSGIYQIIDDTPDIYGNVKVVSCLFPSIEKIVNKNDLERIYYWSETTNNSYVSPSLSMLYRPTTIEKNTRLKGESPHHYPCRTLKVIYDKAFIVWRISGLFKEFGSDDCDLLKHLFDDVIDTIKANEHNQKLASSHGINLDE